MGKREKKQLQNLKYSDNLDDISTIGLDSIDEYLGND